MEQELMTVRRVEYHELEKHIRRIYGFEDPEGQFSIVAMEEWHNDGGHLFRMEKKPLDKWRQSDLDNWKTNPLAYQYVLRAILQDMVNNGHLEEGNYLVAVFW